ncbi:MAG: tetratricopeptide repeat protein, partial [Candidatus Zipacnadales bacterium]
KPMECPVCKKPVQREDLFCKHCGARLGKPTRGGPSATLCDMEAEFRSHLVDKPNDADALYNLGLAQLYSANYGAAADAFQEVIRLLPDEASGYEKLALALAKLGRKEDALEQARIALRLNPESKSVARLVRLLEG